MLVRVLGAAAGGGFPQWNCGCRNCAGVRAGTLRAVPRTQESVAVSADGESWFLLNASPEVRAQIEAFSPLRPRGPRHTPIHGILITNGDLDHCLGLLCLRESQPLAVYATDTVRAGFVEHNPMYRTLQRFDGHTTWHRLEDGRRLALARLDGAPSGLSVETVVLDGKPPLHLAGLPLRGHEHTVGLVIEERATRRRLAYFSSVASVSERLLAAIGGADCLFFDGTFWDEDELIRAGAGDKRARDMAHLPIGGVDGSLQALRDIRCANRIFIHINNTNPILHEGSPEGRAVAEAGWQVSFDGMEMRI